MILNISIFHFILKKKKDRDAWPVCMHVCVPLNIQYSARALTLSESIDFFSEKGISWDFPQMAQKIGINSNKISERSFSGFCKIDSRAI